MSDWKVPAVCGVVAVVGLVAWLSEGSAGALSYRDDWGQTLAEARETGKPILINFGGDW